MTDTSPSATDPESIKSPGGDVASNNSRDGNPQLRTVLVIVALLVVVAGAVAIVVVLRNGERDLGIDEFVTTKGSFEVTARLVEIRGEFLPNDNFYNYAFVMKYEIDEVHRGEVDTKEIVVGHYNPLKPRPAVADEFFPDIGGTLKKFRAGDRHRMALEVPIEEYCLVGIVNRYFDEKKGPIYWGVWTNQVGP